MVKDQVPLSESVIKRVHYLVLADKREDRGVYRKVPVRIMGAKHEPVQPYLIQPKMDQYMIEKDGWYQVKQKGSHHQYKHPTKSGKVTIPEHGGDLNPDTVKSIMKQAGL